MFHKTWELEKRHGHGHVTHFKAPNDISGMAEARVVKFCAQIDCMTISSACRQNMYVTSNHGPSVTFFIII